MAVVLVTGGARGIGLSIAQAFLESGHQVMIGDLGSSGSDWSYALASRADMQRAVSQGERIKSVELDVTRIDSCKAAVRETVDCFGGLDILVNNAGIVGSGPLADFNEAEWDRIFAVNTKGIFLMTQAALSELQNSNLAAIVNTASIAGKQGVPNMSAYCGSKFGQSVLRSPWRWNWPPMILRHAVCPGIVGTAMWLDHLLPSNFAVTDEKKQNFEELMAKRIPLGRPQTTEDIAAAVMYLATARNVTGIALTVAGGIQLN